VRKFANILILIAVCGNAVSAAGDVLPRGTWKLRSQRTIAGTPPKFSPGLVMTFGADNRGARLSGPVPPSIVEHDRMRFTVSADGRVLTQEAKGIDDKTHRPYRYVLTWDKQ
jgi:hypothetical protein